MFYIINNTNYVSHKHERGGYLMDKLTEKEKACLLEYTNDLKQLMEQNNLSTISDNRCSYTRQEIDALEKKVKKSTINYLTLLSQ